MLRAYLLTMFLIPLLDLFDVAFERYASRYDRYGGYPYRWFDFGYLQERGKPDVKFWHLRLPSYVWADFDYTRYQDWGQRVICWTSTGGLRVLVWSCK